MTKPSFVANFTSGRAESSLLVNHAAKASNCSAGLCRAFPGILRCPVRSAGMISMPAIVPRTAQNHWNPSIGRTIRFPALWALVRHSESHKQFILWEASDHPPAHGLGHPELGHTIEHRAFYPRFRALRVKAPRPELPPNSLLNRNMVFSAILWRVPPLSTRHAERPCAAICCSMWLRAARQPMGSEVGHGWTAPGTKFGVAPRWSTASSHARASSAPSPDTCPIGSAICASSEGNC